MKDEDEGLVAYRHRSVCGFDQVANWSSVASAWTHSYCVLPQELHFSLTILTRSADDELMRDLLEWERSHQDSLQPLSSGLLILRIDGLAANFETRPGTAGYLDREAPEMRWNLRLGVDLKTGAAAVFSLDWPKAELAFSLALDLEYFRTEARQCEALAFENC